MDGRWFRVAALSILALALIVRLAAGVWWQQRLPQGTRFFFPDSESYWQLGRAMAQGQPYEYGQERARIFRTPGYPLLLAPLFLLMGNDPSVMSARVLSALLGTASVAAVMGLARTLFEARTALVAGLLTAIDPGAITNGVFILSEAPFCPLMVLNVWAWVMAWRVSNWRSRMIYAAWAGVAAGLATLMRPSWLLFVPFAGIVDTLALIRSVRQAVLRSNFALVKQHALIAATMLGALVLTMSPWWLRNYSITGRFIPTTLQVGASLYDGLSPQADGSSDMDFVPRFVQQQRWEDAAAIEPIKDSFEERLDWRMRDASIAWAMTHSLRVLQLAGVKFVRMWSPWPHAEGLGGVAARVAIAAGYVPLIVLGLIGAWQFGRRDRAAAVLILPAIYFSLLHIVFVSSLRYRQPAMLLFAVLAAAVVVSWYDALSAVHREVPA